MATYQRLRGKWRRILKGTPTKEELDQFKKELEDLTYFKKKTASNFS